MENETNPTQTGVAAESGENFTDIAADNPNATDVELLTALLTESTKQGETLTDIKTEIIAQKESTAIIQSQLIETYKLLAFIFLLLIIYGVYKFFSGLINTA